MTTKDEKALIRANASLKKKQEAVAREKARIKNLKTRAAAKKKKHDTRRKILVGAYFMAKLTPEEIAAEMDGYLERPRDRELFDLEPQQNVGDEILKGMNQAVAYMGGDADGARVTKVSVDDEVNDLHLIDTTTD